MESSSIRHKLDVKKIQSNDFHARKLNGRFGLARFPLFEPEARYLCCCIFVVVVTCPFSMMLSLLLLLFFVSRLWNQEKIYLLMNNASQLAS